MFMKRLKIIAGISWAVAGVVLMLILFPGLNRFSESLASLPFMKINANYTGGEIAKQHITPNCTLAIRRPVFDGLLGEKNHGFVQLDWRGDLPEYLQDTIDYDSDGTPDFLIKVNRKNNTSDIQSFNSSVEGINISSPTSYGWAVRIGLEK